MRILFLSRWYPFPPDNGSKIRIYNLLRGIAEHHEIHLISFVESPDGIPDQSVLNDLCRSVSTVPWKKYEPRDKRSFLGFLNTAPRYLAYSFSSEMKREIGKALSRMDIDLIIASQTDTAIYAPCFEHRPAIFEEVEVGVFYEMFAKARSPWGRFRNGLTWGKHRRYLESILRYYQACTVVSEQERQLLAKSLTGDCTIEVIPNFLDLDSYAEVRETPQPNTIIFTGSFRYRPNYEAMLWFSEQIFPRVLRQIPDAQLWITGDPDHLSLPNQTHITLTGYVEDIHALVQRAWVSVVPLKVGGGTRLKILEAMALGTPVVSTSKGAEGLVARSGEHLLLADDPELFAESLIQVLRDADMRQSLALQARQLMREHYDRKVVIPGFLTLIDRVGQLNPHPVEARSLDC